MRKKVGIVGCGVIAQIYVEDFQQCYNDKIEVYACSDIVEERARELAEQYDIPVVCTTEEMMQIPEIDIIMDLAIPAVHTEINQMALRAGKHLYCEKPLAMSMEDARETIAIAKERGLLISCAPETFMGPALQTCRKLIDDGWIGEPISATTNIVGWGPEIWHPHPHFLYQKGAGPHMDMGPYAMAALVDLFGPMKRLQCMSKRSMDKRYIYSMPDRGSYIDVEVDTTYSASAEMVNGVIVGISMTFDTWSSHMPALEVYGTEGCLQIPHPADFAGKIMLYRANGVVDSLEGRGDVPGKDSWYEIPMLYCGSLGNRRGIGVVDLAAAIDVGRKPRANEDFVLHCLEIALAFDKASASGETYWFETSCSRPEPMPQCIEIARMD